MSWDTREDDLRLGRRALTHELVDAQTLSKLLLQRARGDGDSMAELLISQTSLGEGEVRLLQAELGSSPAGPEDDPNRGFERGQIMMGIRCDAVLERAELMTYYLGARPRDPEPVCLLEVHPGAIKRGLWVDFLEAVRDTERVLSENVSRPLEVGRLGDGFGIVTRFFKGQVSLRKLLNHLQRLKLSEALRITGELAQGLRDLHAARITHRDVNPDNILLTRDGHVFLRNTGVVFEPSGARDFALPATVFGSPHYLAPECLKGDPVHPKSDIYALGVVCYEMCTGLRPFEGESLADLRPQHLGLKPLLPHNYIPDIPENVSELLKWLLSKDPRERPDATKLINVTKTLANNLTRSGSTSRFEAYDGGQLEL